MTTFDAHANFAYALVTVPPVPAGAGFSLTVSDASLFPATPFNAVVWASEECAFESNSEVIRVTAAAGNVFTILRAQEGTTARVILVGDQIGNTDTAKVFDDIEDAINSIEVNAVFDGDAAGGDLDGTYPDPTLREIVSAQTGIGGPADGVVLDIDAKGRVTGLTTVALEGVPPGGPAGGVLSGQFPDPDFAVPMATQAELDALAGAVVLDGAAAGGVLEGTFPDPGLAAGVAGAGLAETADVLSVNVDGSTLEIDADALRVKDGGITVAKLSFDPATQTELDAVAAADLARSKPNLIYQDMILS